VSIILLAGATLAVTPLLTRVTLNRVLNRLGAEDVTIEDIDINPFAGSLSIDDVQFMMDENITLKDGDLYIELEWSSLFGKKVSITRLSIRNADLVIEKDDSGKFSFSGLDVPGSGAQSKRMEKPKWGYGIILAGVYNSSITFMDPEHTIQLIISDAELKGYESWVKDAETRFDLRGKLNNADLNLVAVLHPPTEQRKITGHVFLNDLPLGELIDLSLSDQHAFDALLSIDADVGILIGADRSIVVEEEGRIALDALKVVHDEMMVAAENVVWQGDAFIDIGKDTTPEWHVDGTLRMSEQELDILNQDISIQFADFLWSGSIDSGNENKASTLEGDLRLNEVSIADSKRVIAADKFVWNGNVAVGVERDISPEWHVEGTLSIINQKLKSLDRNISIQVDETGWSGLIESGNVSENKGPSVEGDLRFNDVQIEQVNTPEQSVHIDHGTKKSSVISAGKIGINDMSVGDKAALKLGEVFLDTLSVNHDSLSLNVQKIHITGAGARSDEEINVSTARIDGASLKISDDATSESDSLPLAFSRLDVRQITLTDKETLEIGLIQIHDILTELRRDVNGKIISRKSTRDEYSDTELEERDAADTGFQFHVSDFSLLGKNNIVFRDMSVDPNTEFDIQISQLNLRNLGNMNRQEYFRFQTGMEVDRHTAIEAAGSIEMYKQPPEMEISMNIDALDLPTVSSYLDKTMGYRIDRGHMDLHTDLHIREGKLDLQNMLILRNLQVTHFDRAKAKKTLSIYAVPLESAIKVLSEENTTMELKIPISADLNDPRLNLEKQITATLTKAIRDTLGATLGSTMRSSTKDVKVITSKGSRRAADIQFKSVEFVQGTALLTNAARYYLGVVAQLMEDYPEIDLKIRGFSTEGDRRVYPDEEKLYSIAKQRGLSVKDYLVNDEGVHAKRLFMSPPQIDDEKDALPRVELIE
jgi:hypothetical protein